MAYDHPLPTNLIPAGDICVPLFIPDDPDYIALLVRAIRLLELDRHYEKKAGHEGEVVREQWRTRTVTPLIDALARGIHCGGCLTMWPFNPAIEWFPNDPYKTPDLVPEGYVFPPWYIADTIAGIIYDAEMHSAITSIERIPAGSWPFIVPASGWPRFRVSFSGTGTIELHFASIHKGSLIQVQVDDEILGMEWVDVNQDALGIPPETSNISIYEREITTPGDHHIDCTIIPALDVPPVPFSYGGGLVKVEICGFTPQFPGTGSDLQGLQMRLTAECGMEFSTDEGGEWQPVTGWDTQSMGCFLGDAGAAGLDGVDGDDGIDGDDGMDGTDGVDGDDGQTANEFPPLPDPETAGMCGATYHVAEELSIYIQLVILDAATITLEEFLIALMGLGGFDGSLLVLFWDWVIANVNPDLDTEVSAAQLTVWEHLYCANMDIPTARTAINADTSITVDARYAYSAAMDSLEDGKFALWAFVGAQDTTRDCSTFACAEWCYVLDYKINQNGFDPLPFQQEQDAALWQAGNGWRAIYTNPHVAMLGEQPFAETEIIEVEIVVRWGTLWSNPFITLYGRKPDDTADVLATLAPDTPDTTYILNWQGSANYKAIPVWLAQGNGLQMHLEKMTIKGKGASPFGDDNC